MEGGEGMVAVVRGLRDSALAVTLLDGGRQYTLIPNGQNPSPERIRSTHGSPPVGLVSPRAHMPLTVHTMPATQQASIQHPQMRSCAEMCDQSVRCESGSQATDGRYASMYKMAHCRVNPTSPPIQLTEFPPQRAELSPGHGNFEVGGLGSGENYVPCRSRASFRGGMSWPDRGAVCSPRPSRGPDAFANSLRKYPNISMERSNEMVERLITYTQAKNLLKSYQTSRYPSPSRNGMNLNASNQELGSSTSRSTVPRSAWCDPEANVSRTIRPRMEESPTRDLRDCDCGYRRMMKSGGDRCVNVKKVKEHLRSVSYTVPSYHQPIVHQAAIKERYNQNGTISGMKSPCLTATNSVNMEIQAAAEMVSREVATVPRTEPVKRTVAVPLSPTSSRENYSREGEVSQAPLSPTHKSVEISSMPVDLSIQTTSSTIDNAYPMRKCRCFIDTSKSKEKLNIDKQFSDEIMELLDNVSVCPNADPKAHELRREVLKQMSVRLQKMSENVSVIEGEKNEICKLLKYVPIWVPCGDVKTYRDAISDEIVNKMNRYKACNAVYRAETQIKMKTEENDLEEILHNVIAGMPIKTMDIFGKPLERNHIIETYVKRVKRLIINLKDKADSNLFKSEILVSISNIPIAISATNKVAYLSKIVDVLMNKMSYSFTIKHDSEILNTKPKTSEKMKVVDNRLKKYVQPTEDELRGYITDEIKHLLERTNIQVHNTKDIETEIIDVLLESIQDLRQGKDHNLTNEIFLVLLQEIDNLPANEARIFTEKIIHNVRKNFNADASTNEDDPLNISFQSYVVPQTTSKINAEKNNFRFCSESISKREIDENLEIYMNQLMQEIDDWLENLNTQIPQAHEAGFKQVRVGDLARHIVERRKHIELNPSCKGTDEEELEHLRYLIFKWINELVGEDNMDTIAYASNLLQRILCIPTPLVTEPQANTIHRSDDSPPRNKRTSDRKVKAIPSFFKNTNQVLPTNMSNIRYDVYHNSQITKTDNANASYCSSPPIKPSSPAVNQLNEEYDEFVKNWVQEIPIPSSNSKEKAVADKVRLGIYNGVWKAVTKLKFDPATFHNPFYYEDELDDEIEELFSALPKTQEFETKKHLLKVKLIERTTNTNELIKSTSAPSSFKQQLVKSVIKSLPQKYQAKEQEDSKKAYEEQQVIKIVDNFILCHKYKADDKIKANLYRNKLIKDVQKLITNLKTTHGKELKDINPDLYTNTILNALQKVPLPHENTIQDEAGEILLGQEIDQWYSDLPVEQNNDVGQQMQRKRIKDSLVKRVHELEKEVNISDCSGERALKNEVSMFLEKIPLDKDEDVNFIAEEFTNRMKNIAKQTQNTPGKKSVAFMDSVGYFNFSGQIPYCSSFSRIPGARPAVRDQSSYMIKDGNIVKDSTSIELGRNEYAADESYKTIPSDQFLTMQDSQAPQQASRMKIQPQMQNPDWQPIPMAPPSMVQTSPRRPMNVPGGELYKTLPSDQFHTMQDSQAPQQASQMMQPQMQNPDWQPLPMAPPSIVQASPDRKQSSCCRNEFSPSRRSIKGFSDVPQAPRMSGVRTDQHNKDLFVPVSSVPTEPSCSAGNQQSNLNGSNSTSPTRQRTSIPIEDMINPEGVINPNSMVNPNGMLTQSPLDGPKLMHHSNRELLGNSLQGMNIQDGLPSNVSYGEPQGFSTPQQVITQGSPPRPGRKKMRNSKNRRDFARRRLDLEYDTEDLESEEECQCLERMVRYRRPPVCYAYDGSDMDNPPCYPISYGCRYFY